MGMLHNYELLYSIEPLAELLNAMYFDVIRIEMDDFLKVLQKIEHIAEDGRVWFQLVDWNGHMMVETTNSKIPIRLDANVRG